MAFQFIPPFEEGDKQTNDETGVEYIFTDGAWRPLGPKIEDQFDELDKRYVKSSGDEYDIEKYLKFPGGGLGFFSKNNTKSSYLYNGSDTLTQWTAYNGTSIKITARDGDPGGGRTFIDIKNANSSGVDGDDDGYRMKLYHVADPEGDLHAANRRYVDNAVDGLATEDYVDEQIAAIPEPTGAGVPVGSIMIWMNSTAPAGWFKLQGGTFDTTANPLLHAYLQNTEGYTSGRLPNWSGRYPGEYGNHLTYGLGTQVDYETARPKNAFTTDNPGNHKHGYGNNDYGGGATNTAHDSRNQSKYETDAAGAHTHTITGGGDSTTRPRTIFVHYIIKHD